MIRMMSCCNPRLKKAYKIFDLPWPLWNVVHLHTFSTTSFPFDTNICIRGDTCTEPCDEFKPGIDRNLSVDECFGLENFRLMGSRDSSTAWEQRKIEKEHNGERFEEHIAVSGRVGQ